MILSIDTTNSETVVIALTSCSGLALARKRFKARFRQSEKLLPAIDKLFKANKLKLSDLSRIEVENSGGSFTALRLGVVTANALAYALGIPVLATKTLGVQLDTECQKFKKFSLVKPLYDREPEITIKKKNVDKLVDK